MTMKNILILASLVVVLAIAAVIAVPILTNDPFETTDDGTRLPIVGEAVDGLYQVTSPEGPKPTASYSQLLKSNEGAATKKAKTGDVVAIHFQVVSWESGKTSEATRKLVEKPIEVEAGLKTDDIMSGKVSPKRSVIVPEFLSQALVGTAAGDRKLVIFPSNTKDLPVHLKQSDAYALVVDVIEVL